jgi:hypothetical protein
MADAKPRRHPVIFALDVLIFVFAGLELIEALFHVGLGLILPEAALQVVVLIMRALALWHASRHV